MIDINAVQYPGLDPGMKGRHSGKTREIQIKSVVNSTVTM